MTRTLTDSLRWVDEGTALVRRALAGLGADDAAWEGDSALAGWTRKHLLAHLAANADAVGHLVTWASTGVETPMYTSPAQRNTDIEAGATQPVRDLLAWFERSATQLGDGFAGLTDTQWAHEVLTAQGRAVPASETPWLRAREVMVHAVDLNGGVSFGDLPADFLVALEEDIRAKRATAGHHVPDVDGEHAHVVAWLAGRTHHGVTATADGNAAPTLQPWL